MPRALEAAAPALLCNRCRRSHRFRSTAQAKPASRVGTSASVGRSGTLIVGNRSETAMLIILRLQAPPAAADDHAIRCPHTRLQAHRLAGQRSNRRRATGRSRRDSRRLAGVPAACAGTALDHRQAVCLKGLAPLRRSRVASRTRPLVSRGTSESPIRRRVQSREAPRRRCWHHPCAAPRNALRLDDTNIGVERARAIPLGNDHAFLDPPRKSLGRDFCNWSRA